MSPPGTGISSRHLAGAGLDTSEGRSFIRDRLALLGKLTLFAGGGAFLALLLLNLAYKPVIGTMYGRPNPFTEAGALVMGALWLVARLRDWRLRTLGILDAVALLACCTMWALMIGDRPEMVFVALLAGIVTVNARAVIVPSSARRTFWLSLAALAPTLAAALVVPYPQIQAAAPLRLLFIGVRTGLWIAIGVACATLASHVIYGLRQRVKEATELGQYTLEEQIGSGGMGEIWRARHRLLIRPAAVKLIRPQALGSAPGDPELLLRRFEREARATAALQSPHTVQLYDFGVADDGTLYYVMELLEGLDLERLVERFGPLPAERVVYILVQVCSSLADAHEKGLVHRDIKPANVILGRFGVNHDYVKVLDFGLVKLHRADETEAVRLTGAGITAGTPAFMAPEVALGEEHADHRVDLYSLGCVAYWLLTGRLVFEGATGMKIMLEHARTPAPPPSTRSELPIPAELERIVLDCLAKDPADRPASAAVLAARLAACPLPAPWTEERAARWWSAHLPVAAGARPLAEVLLSHEAHPRASFRRQPRS